MKITSLLLLICLNMGIFAQNYIPYHAAVNQAELDIVDGDYAAALQKYQQAFALVEKPFAKDLYNAAQCAGLESQTSPGLEYVVQLLKKGIPLTQLNAKSLKSLKKAPEWKEIKQNAAGWVESGRRAIDQQLLARVNEIHDRDQRIRKPKYGYPVSDTIAFEDSINMIAMNEILNTVGYPDENRIGIREPYYFNPPHYVAIRHDYQLNISQLSNSLLESVKKGQLSPRVFAELEDKKYMMMNQQEKYGCYAWINVSGEMHLNKYDQDKIDVFNANRPNIGLESWEDYCRKVKFQDAQKEFQFDIYEGLLYMPKSVYYSKPRPQESE